MWRAAKSGGLRGQGGYAVDSRSNLKLARIGSGVNFAINSHETRVMSNELLVKANGPLAMNIAQFAVRTTQARQIYVIIKLINHSGLCK